MGILQWTPEQFWSSTMHDLLIALDGWREAYGSQPTDGPPQGDNIAMVHRLRKLLDDAKTAERSMKNDSG